MALRCRANEAKKGAPPPLPGAKCINAPDATAGTDFLFSSDLGVSARQVQRGLRLWRC